MSLTASHAALNEAANIKAPVLLHVAGSDHLCPPQAQQQLIDAFAPRGELVKVIIHANADHGFARSGSKMFQADVARRADAETHAFLDRHLR